MWVTEKGAEGEPSSPSPFHSGRQAHSWHSPFSDFLSFVADEVPQPMSSKSCMFMNSTSHSKTVWKGFPLRCEEPLLTDSPGSQILMRRTHKGGRKAPVNKVSKGCSAGFILCFSSTAVHHVMWKVIRHNLILIYFPKHSSSNTADIGCFSATHKLYLARI